MKKLLVCALLAATPTFAAVSVNLSGPTFATGDFSLTTTFTTSANESILQISYTLGVDKPGPNGSEYFHVTSIARAPEMSIGIGTSALPAAVKAPGSPNGAIVTSLGAGYFGVSSGTYPLTSMAISAHLGAGVPFDYYTFSLYDVQIVLEDNSELPASEISSNEWTVQAPEPGAAIMLLLTAPIALIRRRRRS